MEQNVARWRPLGTLFPLDVVQDRTSRRSLLRAVSALLLGRRARYSLKGWPAVNGILILGRGRIRFTPCVPASFR